MRNEHLLKQCADVDAAVAHLLDLGVEVLSIHIGPANLPPTIRVRPCDYTRQFDPRAVSCPYTGERRFRMADYELAWGVIEEIHA